MKTAFLGLGVMGYPMAGHLAAKGYDVAVYNRTGAKAESWVKDHKGAAAAMPADVVKDADLIFACLGDDPDVEAVVAASMDGLKEGAVFVDHTTASPALARALHAQLGEKGVGFVDAPVSGGQAGAENGKLSVMCGGDAAHVEKARPAMEAYSARIVHIGPAGHGQLCKAVNQICIAGVLQGLSEGVHFAAQAGLDIDRVLEAISGGAAQSWQMENRAKTMAADEFDFGFAVDWMRKDLRIALAEARENGARLPATALVDQFYADVQAMGGGRWDTSSLVRRLNKSG
ncbi:NAD(P)-dependent oxidoreductase [Hyphococcus luteus]|uniref:Oxidoreductase n=1 Tax=Hyphococcus luteus TaxID=2058213 RepID=A0A2S7K0K4_9PROT|nr:NAD(P)-dependent oxidoreductase [Marinicaulis flavus]PQA86040.1 oxidoreductase [Marinicaulis flavus]